jgi:excisionase family DNA binding protein
VPQIKKRPKPVQAPVSAAPEANGPPCEVLTLGEAAGYLRLSEEVVLRLVREQNLPARQAGAEWRFLKSAIQDWLRTGSPPPKSNKEAWMELAGAWKDDPYVEAELKEIYKRRGHGAVEDES